MKALIGLTIGFLIGREIYKNKNKYEAEKMEDSLKSKLIESTKS